MISHLSVPVLRRAVVLALALSAFLAIGICMAGDKAAAVINCDIQKGSCTHPLGDGKVTLEVLPRPVKAMADLTFRVTAQDLSPTDDPSIDLFMSAMKMGKNLVKLKPSDKGGYEGNGVIVRCRSGIPTWNAKITLPGVGDTVFTFDVIY